MKLLNGSELAGYIKVRHAQVVRGLKQSRQVTPRLAIVRTNPDPVVDSYMRLKRGYGQDIGVDVNVHTIEQTEVLDRIKALNLDPAVHGVIVQLPLDDPAQTEEVLNTVAAYKDVDGLATDSPFDPATPLAIIWLLAGYNVELKNQRVVLIGHGRLVGAPLAKMLRASGVEVTVADKKTKDLAALTKTADVIIAATGIPELINKDMVKPTAVIVDAGVATDKNGLVGDISQDVRELPEITITPKKGGVGPLTVCALFENVLKAARNQLSG